MVEREGDSEYLIIDDALASMASIVFPDPTVCLSWIIIGEWLDADGEIFTMTFTDVKTPEWRQKGLLHNAIEKWEEDK